MCEGLQVRDILGYAVFEGGEEGMPAQAQAQPLLFRGRSTQRARNPPRWALLPRLWQRAPVPMAPRGERVMPPAPLSDHVAFMSAKLPIDFFEGNANYRTCALQ